MTKLKEICAICGELKEMTFEHSPPKSALNEIPVFQKDFRHIDPNNPYLFGKKSRSNKGMGYNRLCKECNNQTGALYAKDYAEVVKSFIKYRLKSRKEFKIKPLNFFKQVVIMHMCADRAGGVLRNKDLKEFILNPNSNIFNEEINVHMYCTPSKLHRFIGISTSFIPDLNEIINCSEVNFHPFGFLLTLERKKQFREMIDITHFKTFKYDEEINFEIYPPVYKVNTPWPGNYDE